MKQIGEWQYEERDYDVWGKKTRSIDLLLLHKKQHWVGEEHINKGKCRCGAEIPKVLLLHRAMLKAGWSE